MIELAGAFVDFLQQVEPRWSVGYFRWVWYPGQYGCNGSYVARGSVELLSFLNHSPFFECLRDRCAMFIALLEEYQGLFLPTITSDPKYRIDFDYANPARWRITKLDGNTGIPKGVHASIQVR